MTGLRLARAHTRRGGFTRVSGTSGFVIAYNDAVALRETMSEHASQIGCVILELPFMKGTVIPPTDAFVDALREIAADETVVLLLDEVLTGFTVGRAGPDTIFA